MFRIHSHAFLFAERSGARGARLSSLWIRKASEGNQIKDSPCAINFICFPYHSVLYENLWAEGWRRREAFDIIKFAQRMWLCCKWFAFCNMPTHHHMLKPHSFTLLALTRRLSSPSTAHIDPNLPPKTQQQHKWLFFYVEIIDKKIFRQMNDSGPCVRFSVFSEGDFTHART